MGAAIFRFLRRQSLVFAAIGNLTRPGLSQDESENSANQQGIFDSLPKVRAEDFEGLRIYIYDFPPSFNSDLQVEFETNAKNEGSNCDYMLSPCTESSSSGSYSIARQRGMEVIIFRKLLASPARTLDPQMADFFVVPHLIGTDCFLNGFLPNCPQMENNEVDLFSKLVHYGPHTRHRHVFLATADMHSLPSFVQAQSIIFSKGASHPNRLGHFVVPTAASNVELQPEQFKMVDVDERHYLFYLAQTPNSAVRFEVQRQLAMVQRIYRTDEYITHLLDEYASRISRQAREIGVVSGGRTGEDWGRLPTSGGYVDAYRNSVFCPTPPTETSGGMKRFIDVILSGCIPVVVAFPTVWGNGISWWKSNGVPFEWALPFPWEIDWRRVVVEVPVQTLFPEGNISLEHWGLAAILAMHPVIDAALELDRAGVEAKLEYISQVRGVLVYDMAGGSRDAFSVLMDGVRAALPSLSAAVGTHVPSAAGFPIVCDKTEMVADPYTMPVEAVGPGVGIDKGWRQSWGKVACGLPLLWRPTPGLITSGHPTKPVRFSQFDLLMLVRGPGMVDSAALGPCSQNVTSTADAQIILSSSPLSRCVSDGLPRACHTLLEMNAGQFTYVRCDQGIGKGHVTMPNPTTGCWLLPKRPTIPLSALERSPRARLEISSFMCSASDWLQTISAELGAFTGKPHHMGLQIFVYDVCGPLLYPGTGIGELSGGVLIDHVISASFAFQAGENVPDVFVLVDYPSAEATAASREGSSNDEKYPTLKSVVSLLAPETYNHDAWLFALTASSTASGPSVCDQYSFRLKAHCSISRRLGDSKSPLALAFSKELLRQIHPSQWERLVFSSAFPMGDGNPDMGTLFVVLADAAEKMHFKITIEEYQVPRDQWGIDMDRCLNKFWDGRIQQDVQSGFNMLSGKALSILDPSSLQSDAIECAQLGGNLVLYSHPWNKEWFRQWPYPEELMSILGSRDLSADAIDHATNFTLCMPSDGCDSSQWGPFGWNYVSSHFLGMPQYLRTLPRQVQVDTKLWSPAEPVLQ